MKYLLILVLFFNFLSPIFAQQTGVLYLKKVKNKFGWFEKGNDKIDWKYSGEIKNGKPNGTGKIYSPYGNYEGEVKNGLLHGHGIYTYKSGRKRKGEFRRGKPWNVKSFDKNGKIEAEWVNGKKLKKNKRKSVKNKEVKDTEFYNFRVRAMLGILPGESNVSNHSLLFIWRNYGLGFNQNFFKITSPENNQYRVTNSSVDLSYTYVDSWDLTAGIGYVFEGKGEVTIDSSVTKYETESVSGYGLFGIFGVKWSGIETLIGARFDNANYSDFKETNTSEVNSIGNKLSVSAIKIIFGVGYHF